MDGIQLDTVTDKFSIKKICTIIDNINNQDPRLGRYLLPFKSSCLQAAPRDLFTRLNDIETMVNSIIQHKRPDALLTEMLNSLAETTAQSKYECLNCNATASRRNSHIPRAV